MEASAGKGVSVRTGTVRSPETSRERNWKVHWAPSRNSKFSFSTAASPMSFVGLALLTSFLPIDFKFPSYSLRSTQALVRNDSITKLSKPSLLLLATRVSLEEINHKAPLAPQSSVLTGVLSLGSFFSLQQPFNVSTFNFPVNSQ